MTVKKIEKICQYYEPEDPNNPDDVCTTQGKYADVVIITDKKSHLLGKDYEFVFGIQNRVPALDYIHETGENIYSNNYDIVVYQNQEILIDPFGFDPDDEDKVPCNNPDDECMMREYSYSFWKADYDEIFEFQDEERTIINAIQIANSNSILIGPIPYITTPGQYPVNYISSGPSYPGPTCEYENNECLDNINEWENSLEYLGDPLTTPGNLRTASYKTTEEDVGPHIVRVTVCDESGLCDYQDIKILVLPIEGGGANTFQDIKPEHASFEDPYELRLTTPQPGVGVFTWFDQMGIGPVTYLLGDPVFGNINPPAYMYLGKDINNPSQDAFDVDVAQPNGDETRLLLEMEDTNGNPLAPFEFPLYVHQCLPHKGNARLYPYNNYLDDIYHQDSIDEFDTDRVCCYGQGFDSPENSPGPWGQYKSGENCYTLMPDKYSFYHLHDKYSYTGNQFSELIPPANIAKIESGGSPADLEEANQHMSLTNPYPPVQLWKLFNDIVIRTYTQSCSGNRGNTCSGGIVDTGQFLECKDRDLDIGETASCEGPCNPNDPEVNCNSANIEDYPREEIGWLHDEQGLKCYSYYSTQDEMKSFERNFLGDTTKTYCNPNQRCSNDEFKYFSGPNSPPEMSEGNWLTKGACGGAGGCSLGVEAVDCLTIDGINYDYPTGKPEGIDQNYWYYFTAGCNHRTDELFDICDPEYGDWLDIDLSEAHCSDASIITEHNTNPLMCSNGFDNSCWFEPGHPFVFGGYEEGIPECCGDDNDEYGAPDCNNIGQEIACCDGPTDYSNSNSDVLTCFTGSNCCNANSMTITTECSGNCVAGETLEVTISGMTGCYSNYYFQIDASDGQDCDFEFNLYQSYSNGINQLTPSSITSVPTITWTIPGFANHPHCNGKTIYLNTLKIFLDSDHENMIFQKAISPAVPVTFNN